MVSPAWHATRAPTCPTVPMADERVDAVVIGAGLGGLAAAQRLHRAGREVVVLEGRAAVGGHTSTIERDGFLFDEGPHVLFTSDEEVRAHLMPAAGPVVAQTARVSNYFDGTWVAHPAQCNLHGLDPDLVARCVLDFLAIDETWPVDDYEGWCRRHLGNTFFEEFTARYTRKYWTVEARDLSTAWVSDRVYRPRAEEVVRGALGADRPTDQHYITSFAYPEHGGYQAFVAGLLDDYPVQLGRAVTHLEPAERRVTCGDGTTYRYDAIVSSVPLPALVAATVGVPTEVAAAAGRLRCTSLAVVDVALHEPPAIDHHWFYVYDEDVVFARGYLPHLLAPGTVPEGCGSLQAEVYFTDTAPLPCELADLPGRVVTDLVTMGVIAGSDAVRWAQARVVPYANVLFDHQRDDALAVVRAWLDDVGIDVCGRYGTWEYLWTDTTVRSGWAAADGVLRRWSTTADG
jgi:protoporphyrinogen oxidase